MSDERPIDPQEVEAFYARQRRQIMDRLPTSAGARDEAAAPRGRWRPLWAAAAVLVLTTVAILWMPGDPEQPVPDELIWDVAEIPPTLEAFGPWVDEAATGTLAEEQRLQSLDWLLGDEEELPAEPAYPEFLEPFGDWSGTVEDPEST